MNVNIDQRVAGVQNDSSSSGSIEAYDQHQNVSRENFVRSRGSTAVIEKRRGTLVMKHGALLKSLGRARTKSFSNAIPGPDDQSFT